MNKVRSGFTMVEVILVLAISSLMLVGVMVGVSSSIARQRYNDAVQDFGEYLRSAYSSVMNVQNSRTGGTSNFRACTLPSQAALATGLAIDTDYGDGTTYLGYPGRTECSIYGKLITFGEEGTDYIHQYDVIGYAVNSSSDIYAMSDAKSKSGNSIIDTLVKVGADVVSLVSSDKQNDFCDIAPAGNSKVYIPQWDARVEVQNGDVFKGSVLIVRSPVTGAIHTFFKEGEAIEIQKTYKSSTSVGCDKASASEQNEKMTTLYDYLVGKEGEEGFKATDIDFCLANDDVIFRLGRRRRNIRILADGNNASAVKLVDQDSGDNQCL